LAAAFVAAFLTVSLAAAAARAEECPSDIPQGSRERRAVAKEWFGKAEAAEAAGDPVNALKAYQCSLKVVPHAFTAFNLARLAEKTGDLELAVEAYGKYLNLAPEAQDRAEVEGKMTALSGRIAASRSDTSPTPAATGPTPEPTPAPAAGPEPARKQERDSELPPALDANASAPRHGISPAVYVVGVVGVAALAGGIVLNLGARAKMDDCYSLVNTQPQTARDACDAAKPRAYGSYALFGAAAAAAVADAIILFTANNDESSKTQVSFAVTPGGATLVSRFRF
jgi:hypothetical protein